MRFRAMIALAGVGGICLIASLRFAAAFPGGLCPKQPFEWAIHQGCLTTQGPYARGYARHVYFQGESAAWAWLQNVLRRRS